MIISKHVMSSRVTFTIESPFCICLSWVSISKYNLNHQHEYNQLGQSLRGALCMAWGPSPAALMKDLFCL